MDKSGKVLPEYSLLINWNHSSTANYQEITGGVRPDKGLTEYTVQLPPTI